MLKHRSLEDRYKVEIPEKSKREQEISECYKTLDGDDEFERDGTLSAPSVE